jgi:hypothetical protein
MNTAPATERNLFRYQGPVFVEEESLVPTPKERLDARLERYLDEEELNKEVRRGERAMLAGILDQQQKGEARIVGVIDRNYREHKEDFYGLASRVTTLEKKFESSPPTRSVPPQQMKAIAHYKRSDNSETFRLTDFEMSELHSNAQTWIAIKAFARAVSIPVAAVLLIALVTWIGLHLWHTPLPAPGMLK